jgi:hypothetical protein
MTDDDIAAAVADAIDPDAPDAAGKARLLAEILLGAAGEAPADAPQPPP